MSENVQRAEQAVRNAQNQLDQALKEIEKARRPKVWQQSFNSGVTVLLKTNAGPWQDFDYPCQVTVRPLDAAEPVSWVTSVGQCDCPHAGKLWLYSSADLFGMLGRKVRVTVEEL